MEKVNNYILSPEALVMVSGSSIGTQNKYYDKGYWYKENKIGYEGEAEYLTSVVLEYSSIKKFVKYEKCTINGKAGCRSKNFINNNETYISFHRLYDTYFGGNLMDRIMGMSTIKERIQYVVEFIEQVAGIDISAFLGEILTFDMLILNNDRHFNNLGLLIDNDKNEFMTAPVFDNGSSLLSNYGLFPPYESLEENIKNVVGRPFSSNLELQAHEFGFPLKINYDSLFKALEKEKSSRALEVLYRQLEKYQDILKDNSITRRKLLEKDKSLLGNLSEKKTIAERGKRNKYGYDISFNEQR